MFPSVAHSPVDLDVLAEQLDLARQQLAARHGGGAMVLVPSASGTTLAADIGAHSLLDERVATVQVRFGRTLVEDDFRDLVGDLRDRFQNLLAALVARQTADEQTAVVRRLDHANRAAGSATGSIKSGQLEQHSPARANLVVVEALDRRPRVLRVAVRQERVAAVAAAEVLWSRA